MVNWKSTACAISLHMDAVPCLKIGKPGTKSFMVISLQGIVAHGRTVDVKHYITGYFSDNICKPSTDNGNDSDREIWRALLWSLHFLWLGIHPTVDMFGNPWDPVFHPAEVALQGAPLAGGYFGMVHIIKGDLDEFAKGLGLQHYADNEPCDFCPANKLNVSAMQCTNSTATAAWKPLLRSKQATVLQISIFVYITYFIIFHHCNE